MSVYISTLRQKAHEAEVISSKLKAKIAELTPEQEAEDLKILLREANCGICELLEIIDNLEV